MNLFKRSSCWLVTLVAAGCIWPLGGGGAEVPSDKSLAAAPGEEVATFAGGCFWCVESDFEKIPGVTRVLSGYSGGPEENPTYKQVSSGSTGHLEAVQVYFDPSKVRYEELLEHFWRHVDPTDAGGQFVDRGMQYRSAVFTRGDAQHKAALASRDRLAASGVFGQRSIVTEIRPFEAFYPAEDYHQDYSRNNPARYSQYRAGSGRDQFLGRTWAGRPAACPVPQAAQPGAKPAPWTAFVKPSDEELKRTLSPLQYKVTQHEGTEPPFNNEYNANKRPGLYVDVVSGEPLFASAHKYDSGTGWPSFWQPLTPDAVTLKEDRSLFATRVEVRSKLADSHLGHVFDDGPQPTGKRYCMNSAALRFVPVEELASQGYGEYLKLFP
ncbi:Peptide methionine sulfoxide reductase MsrA/MsrB [Fundidesulfovibrio magnetotacticus]|uniref:Multifunctional fusion protein n=1 Tax=Fundidesulfovibrio magnetotacticus TaxID=2730080 RepID=A0A6V8LTW4_9BACT|nr:peptide-methionine (R)-S-oxide reductase MsrB [Fundidesulfovibrio magnetotacticus]GFK94380.1 Peptide methionine sulfoxide reductase MsrA/MsrB [Fundidesulfovibrio magnetotacticus]